MGSTECQVHQPLTTLIPPISHFCSLLLSPLNHTYCLYSPWLLFLYPSMTVKRCPDNPMLGRCEILDGMPGKYVWQTYEEVYELVIKVENAMRSCGFGEISDYERYHTAE
ncbi:hypothetical protein F2P56_001809 [Juglans regia]|uniref:Uncharacterized protein n=1 Tax=Juglans regia TaxID=51240 RepID=A0A834DAP2_JUGRE|nr:hypothetical protein F2P56_001809 [Juglans regia]